jgi:hypothetical protein
LRPGLPPESAIPSALNTGTKNRLPLFTLFTTNAISMIGNVLTMIAIP